MLTILSLTSYKFLPAKTGGQKAVALSIKYLAAKTKLTCIGVKSNDVSHAENYELRNILSDSPLRYLNPFYFFTIRKVLREPKADLLIIDHPYYGWLAVLLKWFIGIPLVVRSHNIEGIRFKTLGKWWWFLLWEYERFTHRQAKFNLFMQEQDMQYAITHFGLKPDRCLPLPYGIEWKQPPSKDELQLAGRELRRIHSIGNDEHIILFNGIFDYPPNLNALNRIVDTINPWLQQQTGFKYRIIICGKDIPAQLSQAGHSGIIFAGFVDDISLYFKGADVFINPIIEGGGIKTKLVEALGYNLTAVSTQSGATGINPAICNGKLLLSPDNDWNTFGANILKAASIKTDTPADYFDYFYWGNSVNKVVEFLSK